MKKIINKIRDNKSKDSFVKYLKGNPDQRLFQAMRNWIQININSKWNWLYISDGKDTEDTFYLEKQ